MQPEITAVARAWQLFTQKTVGKLRKFILMSGGQFGALSVTL